MFRKTKIPENKNSSNGTTYFTVTLSSSYNGYKSNKVGNTSKVNNDKSPDVQESRKTPENKEKRVFILSENIVEHVSGYEISHQIENCKVCIRRFSSTKTIHERLCSTNKRKTKSRIDSRSYLLFSNQTATRYHSWRHYPISAEIKDPLV